MDSLDYWILGLRQDEGEDESEGEGEGALLYAYFKALLPPILA